MHCKHHIYQAKVQRIYHIEQTIVYSTHHIAETGPIFWFNIIIILIYWTLGSHSSGWEIEEIAFEYFN